MSESTFLEELEVCEEELIDAYVSNELDRESLSSFEKHFLCTPDRMEKLKFAMALARYTSQAVPETEAETADKQIVITPSSLSWTPRLSAIWNDHVWAFRFATAVAVVAIALVFVWPYVTRTTAPKTFATLTLSISNGDRAEGTPASRVRLPINAEALKISLSFPGATSTAQGYRVEMLNDKSGTTELKVEERTAQTVSVVLLKDQVVRGDYALKLFVIKPDGTEERVGGSYRFTVE